MNQVCILNSLYLLCDHRDVLRWCKALRSFVYTASAEALTFNALREDSAVSPIPFCQNFMRDLRVADLLMDVMRQTCNLLRKQRCEAKCPSSSVPALKYLPVSADWAFLKI